MTKLRLLFMGGESLLIQCAEIAAARGHVISAVVSKNSEIISWANSKGIASFGSQKQLRETDTKPEIDWLLSVANLEVISKDILSLAQNGNLNFHDGPLPEYAGLNTPVWAFLSEEKTHGVSWHLIQDGIDEGDVITERKVDFVEGDTALTINTRCYEAGIESFSELVEKLETGDISGRKQNLESRKYFAKCDRPENCSLVDWNKSAAEVVRFVQALNYGRYRNPLAKPKAVIGDELYYVDTASILDGKSEAVPGTIVSVSSDAIEVSTGTSSVSVALTKSGESENVHSKLRAGLVFDAANSFGDLSDYTKELAPFEGWWERKLLSFSSGQLSHATDHGSGEFIATPIQTTSKVNEEDILAGIGVWLARCGSSDSFGVGYSSLEIQDKFDSLFFSDVVPFTVKFNSASLIKDVRTETKKALSVVKKKLTFAVDLLDRNPNISKPSYDVIFVYGDHTPKSVKDAACIVRLCQTGEIKLETNSSRIRPEMANVLANQFSFAIDSSYSSNSEIVSSLPLVDDLEKQLVLKTWNSTATEFPDDVCVHTVFEEQVGKTPDAIAVSFEKELVSYSELNARANRVARRLVSSGIGPDSLVGLCTDRSVDLLVGALGILKAGGAYVPLDPSYPSDRLSLMVEDSEVSVIVTQEKFKGDFSEKDLSILSLDGEANEIAALSGENLNVECTADNLAYVIYTSGSTGKPKGVMVEHRNVANFFTGMDACISHEEPGVWLAVTSLSFDISVLELFWTLGRGFKVVLSSDEDRSLVSSSPGRAYSNKEIDFSLFYFASDEGENAENKYNLLLEGAKFADENGFEAVWTPERHFHSFGGLYPNPSVTSAAIAAVTSNVKIRAGSCVAPLHHPARIAEEWSLVDNLSGGRVGLSFASGWQPDDFVLAPDNFSNLKEKMFTSIDEVRKLWRGESVSFEGPKGPVEVKTLPRPVQSELPFWVTAAGNPETFEAAGTLGAGLLTHLLGQSTEELKGKIALYRKAWREAGHAGEGVVTLMLHTFIGDDEDSVRETVKGPMIEYLRSSLGLIQKHAWSFPAFKKNARAELSFKDNFESLSSDDTEALLEHSFDRYYETSSLFGTPESCIDTVENCKKIGVDEIACLIDFGINSQEVFDKLPLLKKLREASLPKPRVFSDDDMSIAAQIDRHGVTHLQCTPSMARMVLLNDDSRSALSSVDEIFIGGEALPESLASELRSVTSAEITNMYGPTETTIWSSTQKVSDFSGAISIGKPIANTTMYILDSTNAPSPIGVPGELCIGGDGVTRGYYRRESLTSEKFVDCPLGEGKMYRTGDRAAWRPDGSIEFLGRMDNQVKVRGYRIELGEIEMHLEALAEVREAVVIAREDNPGDKRLVAYVIAGANSVPSSKNIKSKLESILPLHMVPSHIVTLDKFPLTPNNKIDRKALPRPDVATIASAASFSAPSNDVEEKIAEVWKRVLGLSRIGRVDNFFELGGHSLLAVQMHRELSSVVSSKITVTDLFRYPTLEGLAAFLGGEKSDADLDLSVSSNRGSARRNRQEQLRRLRASR